MSPSVVPAHWLQTGVAAADGEGFQAPGVEDFWWPLFGSDTSNWTFTRPAFVVMASVVIIGLFFVTVAGRLKVVPTKRQWLAEQAYGFVRNTIARDIIGPLTIRPSEAPIICPPAARARCAS